jgi:hypothetical protein
MSQWQRLGFCCPFGDFSVCLGFCCLVWVFVARFPSTTWRKARTERWPSSGGEASPQGRAESGIEKGRNGQDGRRPPENGPGPGVPWVVEARERGNLGDERGLGIPMESGMMRAS